MNDPDSNFRRKVTWVVVGIIVMFVLTVAGCLGYWRLQLSHSVDRQLAAIHEQGLPASGRELNEWYRAIPAESNAATLCILASEEIEKKEGKQPFLKIQIPPPRTPLSNDVREKFLEILKRNAPAIALAEKPPASPESRYPIDLSSGHLTELPHLSRIKYLAELLQFNAFVASDARDLPKAVLSIKTMFAVAHTLDSEPLVISQMVKSSVMAMGFNTTERVLCENQLDDERLAELARVMAAAEFTNETARALIGERAMMIPWFRMTQSDMAQLSKSGDEDERDHNSPPKPALGSGQLPGFLRVTGIFERDLDFYLKAMAANIAAAKLDPPQNLKAAKEAAKLADQAQSNYCFFSSLLLPSVNWVIDKGNESLARVRVARVALAVERYHLLHERLPENLGELVPPFLDKIPADPFTGASLLFKQLTNGYVIYSVGPDGVDNGGLERQKKNPHKSVPPYDITFTVER